MVRRLLFILAVLLLLFSETALAEKSRLPGPCDMTAEERALIRARGSMNASPVLDAALSLLEEGNPFLIRYNIITGSAVQARMPYGVPYTLTELKENMMWEELNVIWHLSSLSGSILLTSPRILPGVTADR